ncbi:MAG: DUF1638 domain-containing protein [Burkholderiaceae bacterium]|nr:DUF1638 domain-containing protein [Burkholderiaceae bacterium]
MKTMSFTIDATQPVSRDRAERTLIVCCGALAREIRALISANGWDHIGICCLPAIWHNTPARIPEALRSRIRENRDRFEHIFVAYGDCGTGGRIDQVLREEGVERIEGPHCYSFYATQAVFDAMAQDEPGTFYLSDYLLRSFERLIVKGLGLDRHPDMLGMVFGRYRRLVYLAQTDDEHLAECGRRAAKRLGLAYERRLTGYGQLATFVSLAAMQPRNRRPE